MQKTLVIIFLMLILFPVRKVKSMGVAVPATVYTPEPHSWDVPLPIWALQPPTSTWDPAFLQQIDPRQRKTRWRLEKTKMAEIFLSNFLFLFLDCLSNFYFKLLCGSALSVVNPSWISKIYCFREDFHAPKGPTGEKR